MDGYDMNAFCILCIIHLLMVSLLINNATQNHAFITKSGTLLSQSQGLFYNVYIKNI